jgi:hypothetical protein
MKTGHDIKAQFLVLQEASRAVSAIVEAAAI